MGRTFKRDIFKIPNLLSIFRIILIPIFVFLFFASPEKLYYAFGVLVVSFASDVLDGYFARKYNQVTELGKILDPLADKATQVTILFVMWKQGYVSIFIFLIIFLKELTMGIGAIYLKKFIKTEIISANFWGKSATGCFYLSVTLLMLNNTEAFLYKLGVVGIYLTLLLMIAAFFSYLNIVLKLRKDK